MNKKLLIIMDKECFFFVIFKYLILFDGDILVIIVWCVYNRIIGIILYYIRYYKFKLDGFILVIIVWCLYNRIGIRLDV